MLYKIALKSIRNRKSYKSEEGFRIDKEGLDYERVLKFDIFLISYRGRRTVVIC